MGRQISQVCDLRLQKPPKLLWELIGGLEQNWSIAAIFFFSFICCTFAHPSNKIVIGTKISLKSMVQRSVTHKRTSSELEDVKS